MQRAAQCCTEVQETDAPVFSSIAKMRSSAEVMLRPKGSGNSMGPHFLPLLNAAVSSSSPRMSSGKGAPAASSVKGFISSSVKSRSRNTCSSSRGVHVKSLHTTNV